MASKKKSTKSSNKTTSIFRCVNIAFDKKPKKDRKVATLIITYETASGTWTQQKAFEDVWNFVESITNVDSIRKSNKKTLGQHLSNASKYKDEYLHQNKPQNAFKLMINTFNHIGKNKKILSDSKIPTFIGAKRANLNDIKTAQKISNKKPKTKTKKVSSVGTATFMSSLGGVGGSSSSRNRPTKHTENTDNLNEFEQKTIEEKTDDPHTYKQQIHALQQELNSIKRKHLSDIHDLKQQNMSLQQNNVTLKEINTASQDVRQELEQKVAKYEQELGKNEIDDGIAEIFAHEFKKPDDMAEKYYQQMKKQNIMIDKLDTQVSQLSHNNCDLSLKLARAKSVVDALAVEVAQLTNPNIQQLEEDYAEVEAELDEITKVKESYEQQMIKTAQQLDELSLQVAKMTPIYEEYPNLIDNIASQRHKYDNIMEKLDKLQVERDDFEDKYLDIRNKDVIPMAEYKKTMLGYQEEIKELKYKQNEIEIENKNVVQELSVVKEKMGEIKMKLGELEAENHVLESGGGRGINLEILLDVENDFSIFKSDEFEYASNLSRNQLVLWCDHLKVLVKEINNELCVEINSLSERNERLENYIELKGLPFPTEDDVVIGCDYNELPYPLPSMNFMDDLNVYNPTKTQLKEYIDLMFVEWRQDERDVNKMIMNGFDGDKMLLNQLENDKSDDIDICDELEKSENCEKSDIIVNEALQKQLESAYLRQEEITLELNKKIKNLQESNEELTKQLRNKQQGKTVEKCVNMEEKDDKLLLNRLTDTEQYVKELEDHKKQLEFETLLQKESFEREYKYENELVNIDLQESRQQCDDLDKQIESNDLNLLASQFRNEVGDLRKDNHNLKKKHLDEIRDFERDRDELLREINLLRIKTDRMDINTEEAVGKMQNELEKKNKELQHFEAVASNLSNVKEKLDVMEADRNELEKSYRLLQNKLTNEKQMYVRERQKADGIKRELMIKYSTAQKDIENIKMRNGIDSDTIITKTELVSMKEEMNALKMKRVEAVASKIKLLETSSLEIERMRHEIKVLNGHMRRYANKPSTSRYSVSSMGSSIPFNGVPHQELLGDNNIMGSAWSYTMGMLSSIGSVFANNEHTDSKQHYDYDNNLHRSARPVSSVNHNHNHKHMQHASMAGSYAVNDHELHHNRGLSSSLYTAKLKRERAHKRKQSQHRSYNSHNSHNSYPIVSNISHYGQQASRQDLMLDAEENDNIREPMAKIFNAFNIAQDNVNRQSLDGLNMFGLDIDADNKLQQSSATMYCSDYMRKPYDENDDYLHDIVNAGGGGDDFWGTSMNQNDVDVDNHIHQYSDEDRFGIGDIDLNTL